MTSEKVRVGIDGSPKSPYVLCMYELHMIKDIRALGEKIAAPFIIYRCQSGRLCGQMIVQVVDQGHKLRIERKAKAIEVTTCPPHLECGEPTVVEFWDPYRNYSQM